MLRAFWAGGNRICITISARRYFRESRFFCVFIYTRGLGLLWWLGKESAWNAGDLGREEPLGKGMATHSSSLAWRIPWTEEPG